MVTYGNSQRQLLEKIGAPDARSPSSEWYQKAKSYLRGGDGGEHGLLLYDMIARYAEQDRPLALLDIGTARGFSAITMARALLDTGKAGAVFSVDIVAHDSPRSWHAAKHGSEDALGSGVVSRKALWDEGFPEEASLTTPLTGRSIEFLSAWEHGEIDLAFIDGGHTHETVAGELALVEPLMASDGAIILDDYHTGMAVLEVRSRLLSGLVRGLGAVLRRARIPTSGRLRLGPDTTFTLSLHRFSGLHRAVREFLDRQGGQWCLEVVTMPSRGEYQGTDYALAILTRHRS